MKTGDKYIIYNEIRPQEAVKSRKASDKVPITPALLQKEMLETLSLYKKDEGAFSEVKKIESPSSISEKTTSSPAAKEAVPKKTGGASPPDVLSYSQSKEAVNARKGEVLGKGKILKADQFPGMHNKKLQEGKDAQPLIEGAPNYREIPGENIHGTGQPTVEGMKKILEKTGAGPGGTAKEAKWTSLREEPVIYIDGKPHNLRAAKKLYNNMENPGATGEQVEKTEVQLKEDILKEAAANGGKVLLHSENKDGEITASWIKVDENNVKTTREVFDGLKKEGYRVDYQRVPITDEKRPETKDFDALVNRLKGTDGDTPLIFNCHAGRGRTTTGTVIAGLLRENQKAEGAGQSISGNAAVRRDIGEQGKYQRGEYKAILSLIKIIEKGPGTKEEVDTLIDKYGSAYNLRDDILSKKQKSEDPTKSKSSQKINKEKGKKYLERYHYLIMFNSYLKEQSPGFEKSFDQWTKEKPGFEKLLENLKLAMGITMPGTTPDGTLYA